MAPPPSQNDLTAGGGRSALEGFESDVERALQILHGNTQTGRGSSTGHALVLVEKAVNQVLESNDPEVSNIIPKKLFSLGNELMKLQEYDAAVDMGFIPCAKVSDGDIERRLNSYLLATRCIAQKVEVHVESGKNGDRFDEGESITTLVLQGLDYVRIVHEELCSLSSMEEKERLYWIVFNAVIMCLSLCEPMGAMGHGNLVVDHVVLSIMSMESLLPLCVVKYLPWRTRLYSLAAFCYERKGEFGAAISVVLRLRKNTIELRLDEEQDPPVPPNVLSILDATQRFAEAYLLKAELMFPTEEGKTEENVRSVLSSKLGIDLSSNQVTATTVNFSSIDAKLEALDVLLGVAGKRALVPRTSAVALNYPLEATQPKGLDDICEAVILCIQHQQDDLNVPTLLHLTKSLFHFEKWEAAGATLKAVANITASIEDDVVRQQVELLHALYVVQCPHMSPESIGLNEDDVEKFGGESAQVEGKVFKVNPIRNLANVLEACVKGLLGRREPDLLIDAALLLWSPFCTAMLDTVDASDDSVPINPALLQVATLALTSVHMVFTRCKFDDCLLRGMVALQFAKILHQSSLQDSRYALQVLRRSLQSINVNRQMQLNRTGCVNSLPSFTSDSDILLNDPDQKEIVSLATLQADTLCLMFEIELEMGFLDAQAEHTLKSAPLRSIQVSSTKKEGDEVTVTLKSKQNKTAANDELTSRTTEQRLLNECKQNKYARALLLVMLATKRPANGAYEEKIGMFKRAKKLLQEAVVGEENLIAQLDKEVTSSPSSEETEKPRLPPPIILSRACNEVTLKIKEWTFGGRSRPAYYVLYGKSAGSGTEVSLTNVDLKGTGLPVSQQHKNGLVVTVSNLTPNETYVFAAAAFDAKDKLIGSRIGKSTIEVQTLCPLPVLYCWGLIARMAYTSMRPILEDKTSKLFASLHHTVKDHVLACKDFCSFSSNVVVDYFVVKRPSRELHAANPFEDVGLNASRMLNVAQPLLQSFVHTIILRNKMLSVLPVAGSSKSNCDTLLSMNFNAPAYNNQIEILTRVRYLCLALHTSCAIRDQALTLQLACQIYKDLVSFFRIRRAEPRVLEALLLVQKALWTLPRESWSDMVCATYARTCYEIMRICDQTGQKEFGFSALLPDLEIHDQDELAGDAALPIDDDDLKPAVHYSRTADETLMEQHALAFKLRLEIGSFHNDKAALLEAIHEMVGNLHPFDEKDRSDEKQAADEIGFDEEVILCLASSQRSGTSLGVQDAWKLVQTAEGEYCPEYLYLLSLVCKAALVFEDCPSSEWAEHAQEFIWDLPKDSAGYPTPLVADIMMEERFEHVEPYTAILTHQYPYTESLDPLGLDELVKEQERQQALEQAEQERLMMQQQEQEQDGTEAENGEEGEAEEDQPQDGTSKEEGGEEMEETEEEKLAKLEEADRQTRLDHLRRRSRLIAQYNQTPDAIDRDQLLALSELEAIRAVELYEKWFHIDYSPQNDGTYFLNGVLNEGPSSDLKWRAERPSASPKSPVPPLKPLNNIIEENTEAPRNPAKGGPVFNLDKLEEVVEKTPCILHYCARGIVRARYALCFKQVERLGKVMWNTLVFAWVLPDQFVEECLHEVALVPPLRTILREKHKAELEELEEHTKDTGRSTKNGGSEGKSPRKDTVEEEEDALEEQKSREHGAGMKYDWRVVWRASVAIVEALELTTELEQVEPMDVVWASRLVSFSLQVLYNLGKWCELVSLGEKFVKVVQYNDQLASPVLPLLIYAQQRIVDRARLAEGETAMVLEQFEAEYQEKQNKKKKRQKNRKVRSKPNKVEEALLLEEQQKYEADRSEIESILKKKAERVEELESRLQLLTAKQEELIRDKSTCLEALEKARTLARLTVVEHLVPDGADFNLLIQPPGLSTRRSGIKKSGRSRASRAPSAVSKTSRRTSATTRSRLQNKDDVESVIPEGALQGAYVKPCLTAYNAATQLLRQKDETVLLSQALCELGNLYAAKGNAWDKAIATWTDGVDAIVKQVDSVSNWRDVFSGLLQRRFQEEGQALLRNYGLIGCILGGINLCKVAKHFHYLGNFSLLDRMERYRMAGHLFCAVGAAGMPHPTRHVDWRVYNMTQLFPQVDENLLYNMGVRKACLVEGMQDTCSALMTSECVEDNLLVLPLLSILEFIHRSFLLDFRSIARCRVLKAKVLMRLGLMNDALVNLKSVLLCHCFPNTKRHHVVKLSKDIFEASMSEDDDVDQTEELLARIDEMLVYSDAKLPWEEENYSVLQYLVNEKLLCPYITHILGSELAEEVNLIQLLFVLKAVENWKPEQSSVEREELFSLLQGRLTTSTGEANKFERAVYVSRLLRKNRMIDESIEKICDTLLGKEVLTVVKPNEGEEVNKGEKSETGGDGLVGKEEPVDVVVNTEDFITSFVGWFQLKLELIECLLTQERFEEAIAACERVFDENARGEFHERDSVRQIRLLYALCLYSVGRRTEAVDQVSLVESLFPRDSIDAKTLLVGQFLLNGMSESLETAIAIWEGKLTSLGYNEHKSIYVRFLGDLVNARHYKIATSSGIALTYIEDTIAMLESLPNQFAWVHCSLLFHKAKLDGRFADCLQKTAAECPFDYNLLRKTLLGMNKLKKAHGCAVAAELLRTSGGQVVLGGNKDLTDAEKELERRREKLSAYFFRVFHQVEGIKGLVNMLVQSIEKNGQRPLGVAFPAQKDENLLQVFNYLGEVCPTFKDQFLIQANGDDEDDDDDDEGSCCIQWLDQGNGEYMFVSTISDSTKRVFCSSDLLEMKKKFSRLLLKDFTEAALKEEFAQCLASVKSLFGVNGKDENIAIETPTKETVKSFQDAFNISLGVWENDSQIVNIWKRLLVNEKIVE